MTQIPNRRRHQRVAYPQSGIRTLVKNASGDVLDTQDIQVIDFSRSGLGIQSVNQFAVGDALELEMSLSGGPPLRPTAVICNRRQLEHSFRYGAFFEYEVLPTTAESDQVLKQVEMDLGEMSSAR